jgi:hypothetical protein
MATGGRSVDVDVVYQLICRGSMDGRGEGGREGKEVADFVSIVFIVFCYASFVMPG